jgi:peptide chain release factor 2
MQDIEERLRQLQNLMGQPDFWLDKEKAQKVVKEYNQLKAEYEAQKSRPSYFTGDYDQNNAILTISAGTGGTEAQDWAQMLLRMYLRFAERKGFKIQILDQNFGTEAGIKSASILIQGPYAFGWLKSENGVHRLVRISPFDADRARHTSFALVEVIPEIPNPEIEIRPEDLKIETFRSSGPGGQHMQKTESAVRITHLPTKIVVSCQNSRVQQENKETALNILKSRLYQLSLKEKEKQVEQVRGQVLEASWGNQIRSYVLHPYKMVKDHRTGWESSEPDKFLDGEIEKAIKEYLIKSKAQMSNVK